MIQPTIKRTDDYAQRPAGERDDITPGEPVFTAGDLVGTPRQEILQKLVPGGHIGLFMGAHTLRHGWPEMGAWIGRQRSRAAR
jgi:poly(3-hydroxybutyrate) depolymerase